MVFISKLKVFIFYFSFSLGCPQRRTIRVSVGNNRRIPYTGKSRHHVVKRVPQFNTRAGSCLRVLTPARLKIL